MNLKITNPNRFYNVNENTNNNNYYYYYNKNNNDNNSNNNNSNNNNNNNNNKVSACYCFGMLSSKRSLDQRADPIYQGQNEGIFPISL